MSGPTEAMQRDLLPYIRVHLPSPYKAGKLEAPDCSQYEIYATAPQYCRTVVTSNGETFVLGLLGMLLLVVLNAFLRPHNTPRDVTH